MYNISVIHIQNRLITRFHVCAISGYTDFMTNLKIDFSGPTLQERMQKYVKYLLYSVQQKDIRAAKRWLTIILISNGLSNLNK